MKKAAPAAKKAESSSEDSSDEDDKPAVKPVVQKKSATTPAKKESSSEEDDDEEEEETPVVKTPKNKRKAEEEEEEEDEGPVIKKPAYNNFVKSGEKVSDLLHNKSCGDFQERFWKQLQFFLINLLEKNFLKVKYYLWKSFKFPLNFSLEKTFKFVSLKKVLRLINLTSAMFSPSNRITRLPTSKHRTHLSIIVPTASRRTIILRTIASQ